MAMSPQDLKKLKAEKMRVESARMDLDIRIDEHQENIDRLKASISVQDAKIAELAQKIEDEESSK